MGILYFVFYSLNKNKKNISVEKPNIEATSTFKTLPVETSTIVSIDIDHISLDELEKHDFVNFYQEPVPIPDFNFKNYQLPLNVKIDVLNYYDIFLFSKTHLLLDEIYFVGTI